ncbi:MAG: ice-binding family protein, partial [Candidatus Izemoplasmatales bacterium]|nr:ice-binding family protein [Candidatus Izemoplasmatales bacterium]
VITLSNQDILVESIAVSGADMATVISTYHGTLQMSALVLPANAANKSVVWSIIPGTGTASINSTGLLSAITNGTVTVKATSVSTPSINGTLVITLSNQDILVESIAVSGAGDAIIINVTAGTLQMSALVLPIDAADKSLIWSVQNDTGMASITQAGLLTAIANGTVIVTATSVAVPEVFGSIIITISNQVVVSPIETVNLGLAGDFIILAKAGISATGVTIITGNIGVSPVAATYITGFDLILDSELHFATSSMVVGNIYASDYLDPTPAYLTTAVSDMEAAYTDAAGRAANYTELYAGDISGKTLYAGVYKYGTDLLINTDVVLSGSATDIFIFQIAGKLTLANGINITLTGGVLASNIIWQVAGTVAIGTGSHFVGTILAQTDITVATNAVIDGRLYAQTEVTLDANIVG